MRTASRWVCVCACAALLAATQAHTLEDREPSLTEAPQIPQIIGLTAERKEGDIGNVTCIVSPENATINWIVSVNPQWSIFETNKERVKISTTEGIEQSKGLNETKKKSKISTMIINKGSSDDTGNYTCVVTLDNNNVSKLVSLDFTFKAKLLRTTKSPVTVQLAKHDLIKLACEFKVYTYTGVKWYKKGDTPSSYTDVPFPMSPRTIISTYKIRINSAKNNGTYVCEMEDPVSATKIFGSVDVLVYADPEFISEIAIPINTTQIYLKWTLLSHNAQVNNYYLFCKEAGDGKEFKWCGFVKGNQTSFVLEGLDKSTEYQIQLTVSTEYGYGKSKIMSAITLAKEPIFVPNISVYSISDTSVTLGWSPPPVDVDQFVHYYLLEADNKDKNETKRGYYSSDKRNLPYVFHNLETLTTYVLRVRACSYYDAERCSGWSEGVEATTEGRGEGGRTHLTLHCDTTSIVVVWGHHETELEGYKALIGYGDDVNKLSWICAGALISDKFVLNTGQQCRSARENGPPTYVLKRSDDYNAYNRVNIERIHKHPDHHPPKKYNDIALLELTQQVSLSEFLVPACLDTGKETIGERAFATGWGTTHKPGPVSNDLKKIPMTKFDTESCAEMYPLTRILRDGIDPNTQHCYEMATTTNDTCFIDGGGPLQVLNKEVACMYTVVGLTSFARGCGNKGEPAVYTKVAHYLDWIENIVWP